MNGRRKLFLAFALVLLVTAACAGHAGAPPDAGVPPAPGAYEPRVYENDRGERLPYQLFVPAGYDRRKKYPLVLWLHGAGGRGSDNRKQLAEGNSQGASVWTVPGNQARFPSFVVAPQCPSHAMWTSIDSEVEPTGQLRLVVELLGQLQRDYAIDAGRLYVAGQSMGGFGAWALITEHPGMFAAAVPLCGGGNEARAARAARVPVWAFHGELDRSVRPERSRKMVAALKRAGGAPRYTEYEGDDHAIWDKVFSDPELLPWVFAQRLGGETACGVRH
jgi:predicted peptidase